MALYQQLQAINAKLLGSRQHAVSIVHIGDRELACAGAGCVRERVIER